MNKKFYGTLLLGTLLLGSTIVSCKDYDDDIDNLQNQITQLATKADMQSEVSKLQSAVATAQAAAENKAAAAEQAAKDAAAKAQAAADAAAKAQGTADAAATVEALNKVAADAAAAAQAAADAKAAAEAKAAELEAQLAELQALAATLVSTTDFEAAKKDLNDKYAELAAKIGETTGTTGMTGLQVISGDIAVGYGVWKGVHKGAATAEWDGPKKDEVAKLSKGDYISAFGAKAIEIAVNPTDVDVTNTEFAVVNQFGDIAPVAFGTPEVLTRANAAGTYKVKVASAALTSDIVKEFGKKFEKNTKGANAALVAGKIASTITENFVAVTENKNSDKSAFSTTVKYDEISGVVEVAANNPEYVYDSYITKLDESVDAHDALLWKLEYDGMTLTYDAKAAKKFAGKEFKVVVKQINLNGYIHETVETVKFEAKNTTTEIEMDAVDAKLHTHNVQLDEKSPTTDEDLQFIVLTKDEIIEALGLKKGTEEYIHFGHSTYTTATVGKSYAYSAENDKVEFTNKAATATVKDGNITLKFGKGYPKADFTYGTEDYVTSGSTMYIPVTFEALDNTDLDGNVKTTYTINVPVKFVMPSVKDMYKWDADLTNGTNAQTIEDSFTAKDGYATLIAYYGEKTVKASTTNPVYYTPNITAVLDINNVASYKALVKQIDDLVLGTTTTGVTITAFTTGDVLNIAANGSVTMDIKNTAKTTLKELYMNKVYTTASSDKCYYDTETGWRMGAAYNGTDEIVMVAAAGITDEYSYTIKGLKAQLLTLNDRVVALEDVNVTMNAVAAPTIAMTLTNSQFYLDTDAPALQLSNAALAQDGNGVSFNGSFSIKDKYGYDLIITGLTGISAKEVLANGSTNDLLQSGNEEISITLLSYVTDADAGTTADGLKIKAGANVDDIDPTATKIVVTIPGSQLKRIYDEYVPSTDNVTFELEIVR